MCYHTLITATQKGKWYLVVTQAFGNMKIFSGVQNLYLYLAPSDRDWIFHISVGMQSGSKEIGDASAPKEYIRISSHSTEKKKT